jgi:hypothetical protein
MRTLRFGLCYGVRCLVIPFAGSILATVLFGRAIPRRGIRGRPGHR